MRSSRVDQPPVSGVPVAGATVNIILAHGQPDLTGGGGGFSLTGRIQGIDINTQIHRAFRAYSVAYLFNDTFCADGVYFACFHDFKAAVAVVFVVGGAREGGADAGVDVGVVCEETLRVGVVEVGSVVDGGLVGGGAAEDFGAPGVAAETRGWALVRKEVGVGVKFGKLTDDCRNGLLLLDRRLGLCFGGGGG